MRQYRTISTLSRWVKFLGVAIALALAATFAFASGGSETEQAEPMAMENEPMMMAPESMEGMETAILAGGCFWGVEAVFERLDGVIDVVSGYSGGDADTASYRAVGTGTTGHAEAVQVIFDPETIEYKTLLEVFFSVAHDPTQLNYQGPDVGTEYRSAVFYANQTQKMAVEEYIGELEQAKIYKDKIVTEVAPLDAFYPAEEYHQDFMRLNPQHPYILYWDLPKVNHLEKEFPDLLADNK